MRRFLPAACLPAIMLVACARLPHSPQGNAAAQGEAAFAAADFAAARRAFEAEARTNPTALRAWTRLGSIALLQNRPRDAIAAFLRAERLAPTEREITNGLAEAYYRVGDFAEAAKWSGVSGRAAQGAKLSALSRLHPNAQTWSARQAVVRFERTDPLPVIRIRVNGSEPANFIIDTGGGETILDDDFAREVGAEQYGGDSAAFAGGRRAGFVHGSVRSLELGALTLGNVPVHVQSTRAFAAAGGGMKIVGILGTIALMQARATLDYPRGELRLVPRATPVAGAASVQEVPMALAADHLMLIWGRINDADSTLMLLDTGLAGAAFTAPDSVLRGAGVDLATGGEVQGVGGGGAVSARMVRLAQLRFGTIVRRDLTALAGVFPAALHRQFGFPIGGLISHEIIRPYAVTFDFDRMMVRFDSSRAGSPPLHEG